MYSKQKEHTMNVGDIYYCTISKNKVAIITAIASNRVYYYDQYSVYHNCSVPEFNRRYRLRSRVKL